MTPLPRLETMVLFQVYSSRWPEHWPCHLLVEWGNSVSCSLIHETEGDDNTAHTMDDKELLRLGSTEQHQGWNKILSLTDIHLQIIVLINLPLLEMYARLSINLHMTSDCPKRWKTQWPHLMETNVVCDLKIPRLFISLLTLTLSIENHQKQVLRWKNRLCSDHLLAVVGSRADIDAPNWPNKEQWHFGLNVRSFWMSKGTFKPLMEKYFLSVRESTD